MLVLVWMFNVLFVLCLVRSNLSWARLWWLFVRVGEQALGRRGAFGVPTGSIHPVSHFRLILISTDRARWPALARGGGFWVTEYVMCVITISVGGE